MWTSDNDGPFINQAYVDQYFEDTKNLATDVDTEDEAIALLKRIKYLEYVSDEFFVPSDIFGWEEMALSYIESPQAYFKHVLYDILEKEHKNFFDSTRILELSVMNDLLPEVTLFDLVREFNVGMEKTNANCERYGMMKFSEYWFKSKLLQEHYNKWLIEGDING